MYKMRRANSLLVVLPIVYLFLTVFAGRSDFRIFFALSIFLVVAMAVLCSGVKVHKTQAFAYGLIALASIGLSAATILTIEKIELLQNPNRITSCSFSPIVACSPVIGSPQASAFDGIPNPIFGIFGFTSLLAAGMTIIAGAIKLHRAWWLTVFAGVCFGVVFCIWLLYQGLYDIGALCLYCMSVWMVTFSLFWLVLAYLLDQKILRIHPKIDSFIISQRDSLIAASISIVVLLIFFRWSEYWTSIL